MVIGLEITCQHVLYAKCRGVQDLLCDYFNVGSTRTQECDDDSDVVHNLLGDEEPNGIPEPASVRS